MEFVIEQAKIISPGDAFDTKTISIKIKDGFVHTISSKKISCEKVIKSQNLHLSPGWIDIGSQCGEPGFEHRETLATLAKSAALGGYTTVAVFPNTLPVIQSKSEIEYIKQKTKSLPANIIPVGALSKQCEGKEIAELIDMYQNGAIAFSDGKSPVQDTGVILRAMLYSRHFNGLIINQPEDSAIAALGQIHEGMISQRLGLKGISEIAETIMLRRDLDLAKYTEVNLLSHLLSTQEGVSLLRQHKKVNKKIFSSVGYLNLVFTDEALEDFDSVYKQSPPLRDKKHQKALIKGVKDGTIDIICSNHRALEIEKKDLEFGYATPGAIGLQTSFAAVNTFTEISIFDWVKSVSTNPSRILNIKNTSIKVGNPANFTFFDPTTEWTFDESRIVSLTKNSPFIGKKFKGKVIGTAFNQHLTLNN
ncbi:MAG: dihydroorotase [Saprospiraceae bacterium]